MTSAKSLLLDSELLLQAEDGLVRAVRGVSYEVRRGEVLGIVGESGSGKSVTSLAVMGLLPRSARITGSARLLGQELLRRTDDEMSQVRGRQVAMIFQDPLTSLNPVYTVGTQIAEAVMAHNDVSKKVARDRALDVVLSVGSGFGGFQSAVLLARPGLQP